MVRDRGIVTRLGHEIVPYVLCIFAQSSLHHPLSLDEQNRRMLHRAQLISRDFKERVFRNNHEFPARIQYCCHLWATVDALVPGNLFSKLHEVAVIDTFGVGVKGKMGGLRQWEGWACIARRARRAQILD